LITSDELIEGLLQRVGPEVVVTDLEIIKPFLYEERGLYQGHPQLLVLPRSTEEVASIIEFCAKVNVPVVPQGGNTGLVGGAVAGEGEVLLSLRRMSHILSVDIANSTMIVEGGVVLEEIQEAAKKEGYLFPLKLGAQGSCQIGGNIATNAGGINVLHYGNARELVLGLEVVLPDGRIWNGLRSLHKDNTGYSLKNLFIGSEGTLGVITKAVLKLFPQPRDKITALCALDSVEDALSLLIKMKSRAEYGLTAFELMSSFSFSLACSHYNKSNPIENNYEWFVLLEISGLESTEAMQGRIEELLMEAYDDELIKDVVITKNLRQAGDLWNLRESIPEAQKRLGGSIKHDVSIPVYRIAEFLEVAEKAISQVLPEAKFCTFGHLGDGSIHYNLVQPSNMTESCFFKHTEKVNTIVHDIVDQFEGSFSAEHGIGLMKREELNRRKDPVELDLMYKLKAAIDPLGIMNPGKMLTRRHSPLDR